MKNITIELPDELLIRANEIWGNGLNNFLVGEFEQEVERMGG